MSPTGDATPDWRDEVFAGATRLANSATVQCLLADFDGAPAVVAAWDFTSQGGSFGEADADVFVGAVDVAIERSLPLVTLLRSGGTKLPEGMRALVGIPRSALALRRLRTARLPHVSVADHPTMGGVWVGIGATADLRIAVAGGLVGFSGPRAVTAMTGRSLPEGGNTAEAAYDAGLVDALVDDGGAVELLGRALRVLTIEAPTSPEAAPDDAPARTDAWAQVTASRAGDRASGRELITQLLSESIDLHASDQTVAAAFGHLEGRRVVAAALAGDRDAMPSAAGFRLLSRAADLAGALDLPLIVFVDTPGADPHTETDGLAAAIAESMSAVLACAAPTISLVHGEGGSGGALAGAVTDIVGIGQHAWFAAMGPEGAAATLRIEPSEAASRMSILPADLLANGFGDVLVPDGLQAVWLATTIDRLRAEPAAQRLERRDRRWSSPLPGRALTNSD